MKKQALFSILCTVLLLSGSWMHAEESEDYVPAPIRVVSAFLELTEEQVKTDRKSTRLNSSHLSRSRMPSSA